MSVNGSHAPAERTFRRRVVSVLCALALLPLAALAAPSPATAATSQFRGMNWAQTGDNFSKGLLAIDGLKTTDSYATVQATANAVFDDMQSTLGINTVRLPINTHTVGNAWWNNYRGVIDAATARGMKVILAYWEDGAASGGRVTNTTAYHAMWSTVESQYGSNGLVYFEPMNEPHGYSLGRLAQLRRRLARPPQPGAGRPGAHRRHRLQPGPAGPLQRQPLRRHAVLVPHVRLLLRREHLRRLAQQHHDAPRELRVARRRDRVRRPDERRAQLRRREQHRQLRPLHPRHHPGHARQRHGRHVLAGPRRQARDHRLRLVLDVREDAAAARAPT